MRFGRVVAVVVGRAVCALHDGRVRVHDGLHFAALVGGGSSDVGIGQHAVDHGHRGLARAVDAGDTQGLVVGQDRGQRCIACSSRAIVLRVGSDLGCCGVVGAHSGTDHTRQAPEGVELACIWGRSQRCLHSSQVLGRHARDAQAFQLGLRGVAIHHRLHRIGQRLQLGHGVDRGSVGGCAVAAGRVQHIAQQAEFWRGVHAVDAQGGVLRFGRVVAVVVGRAVCALHDGRVRVHDGLHFAALVGGGSSDVGIGQHAVDHGHRGLARAVDAGDTQGLVVGQDRGQRCIACSSSAIVLRVGSDFGHGIHLCLSPNEHHHIGCQVDHLLTGRCCFCAFQNLRLSTQGNPGCVTRNTRQDDTLRQ